MSYAKDTAGTAARGSNSSFVDAVLDKERCACINLCCSRDAADAGGACYGATAVDDKVANDGAAANDAEEALEVARAVNNHAFDAVALSVERAVVLVGSVEADGRVCIYCALIVDVGGQHTFDGNLMSVIDHRSEPLDVGHAAQFEEAVGVWRDVVLHERAADGAPAIDVVVLRCWRTVVVAVGHIAYGNSGAVHFAHGIDLAVGVERYGESVSA